MFTPQVPSPSQQITIGAALALLAFGALLFLFSACSTSVNSSLVECKLNALKVLPRDPMMVTPYDAVDVVNRIKACEAGADAGQP